MSVIHVGPPTLVASRRAASPTTFEPVEPFVQSSRGERPPPLVLNGASYLLAVDARQVSLRGADGAFEATHPEFLEELQEMMRETTHALVVPGAAPPFVGVRWSALAQSTKNGLRAAMLGNRKDEAFVSVIVLAAAYVYELRDFPRAAAAYDSVAGAMPSYDDVVAALRAGMEAGLATLDAAHETEALALVARAVTTYAAFSAVTWAGTRVFRAITSDLDVPIETGARTYKPSSSDTGAGARTTDGVIKRDRKTGRIYLDKGNGNHDWLDVKNNGNLPRGDANLTSSGLALR